MAPQQHSGRMAPPYLPDSDRNWHHRHKAAERIVAFAAVGALVLSALVFMGVRVEGPGDAGLAMDRRVTANEGDIRVLKQGVDSLARGQRTTNYIACALYAHSFPGTPTPEGCAAERPRRP